MSDVTVITATIGNARLIDNLKSVANQTTKRSVQHLLIVDGPEWTEKVNDVLYEFTRHGYKTDHLCVIYLPYSVGKDRWNGHRMYGAGTYLADGDWVMYLDDDNTLHETHIESCLNTVGNNLQWAFSFRNIVDSDGDFLCEDNCESLGLWASVLDPKDYFIDVNCFFLSKKLAIAMTPIWYRKFREPGQPEVDRVLTNALRFHAREFAPTYKYTVNYTVGNTDRSVQRDFFERGNVEMLRRYNNLLPWKE